MPRPFQPKLVEIPLDSCVNEGNPRHDPGPVGTLALSMKTLGLLNAIIVLLLANGKYRIIAGQRRYLAAKQLGWKTIAALVAENLSEVAELLIATSDNTQRRGMSVEDIATAAMRLSELTGKSDAQIAQLLGVHPTALSQIRSAMVELPAEAKAILKEAKAAPFVYFALRKVPHEQCVTWAKFAIEEKPTRDELAKAIKSHLPKPEKTAKVSLKAASYEKLEEALSAMLARVRSLKKQGVDFKLINQLL